MTNFLDTLVMLLSTDWFKPHWAAIGINLDERQKGLIREGCRNIVSQILSGATEYWLAPFSDERREKTRAMFEALAKTSEAKEAVIETVEQWLKLSDEDLKAGWLFESLTEELVSDDTNHNVPELSSDLTAIVAKARAERYSPEIDFKELSLSSKSSWDRYLAQLTPDLPTYLPDMLFTFSKAQSFKAFWISVLDKVTPEQREELTVWYRTTAKSRALRDIAPNYFSGQTLQ